MAFDIISVYPGNVIKEFPNHKLICETLCTKNINAVDKKYLTQFNRSKIYFFRNNKTEFLKYLFEAIEYFSLSTLKDEFNIILDLEFIKNQIKEFTSKKIIVNFTNQSFFTLYDYKIRLDKECIYLLCNNQIYGNNYNLNKIVNFFHYEIESFNETEIYHITFLSKGAVNVNNLGLSGLVDINQYYIFIKTNCLHRSYLSLNKRQLILFNKIIDRTNINNYDLDKLMSIYPTSMLINLINSPPYSNTFKFRMNHFIKYLELNMEGNEIIVNSIKNIIKENKVIRLNKRNYTKEEKSLAEKAHLKINFKKITSHILALIGSMKEKSKVIEIFVKDGIKPSITLLINMVICASFQPDTLNQLIRILTNIENHMDISNEYN